MIVTHKILDCNEMIVTQKLLDFIIPILYTVPLGCDETTSLTSILLDYKTDFFASEYSMRRRLDRCPPIKNNEKYPFFLDSLAQKLGKFERIRKHVINFQILPNFYSRLQSGFPRAHAAWIRHPVCPNFTYKYKTH